MRVAIAADHAGYALKALLAERLRADGHAVLDLGADDDAPSDYPDYARAVAEAIVREEAERGILVCGSGAGAALAASKFPGVRAVLCHDGYTAHQSVEHDDANVLALGARVIGPELAVELVRTWLASRFAGAERHIQRLAKVAAFERRFPIEELRRHGQSLWYDGLRRSLLASGALRALVRAGVRGVVADPAVVERVVAASTDYDAALHQLLAQGHDDRTIVLTLWREDARAAAAQLRPVYELSDGADGYVSTPLPPDLPDAAASLVTAARDLWRALESPNVLIQVPPTAAGLQAAEELVAEGIGTDVGPIGALATYERAAEAYLRGLERRAAAGRPLDGVASVASFLVGPLDAAVDRLLWARWHAAVDAEEREASAVLLGRAAVANARLAYRRFRVLFAGPRWQTLAARGARIQRLRWAALASHDPRYRDVRYVEDLVAPQTIATLPPATLRAFCDHGYVRPGLAEERAEGRAQPAALAGQRIDVPAVAVEVEVEAGRARRMAFAALLAHVAARRQAGEAAERSGLGAHEATVAAAVARLARQDAARRLWQADPDLWKPGGAQHALVIRQRLGWLTIVEEMRGCIGQLADFADRARQVGLRQAVLLGMGGSSLAPEVLRRTFGSAPEAFDLVVLDTTDPATIRRVEQALDVPRTLFIVASKSGTTVETLSQLHYFYARVRTLRGAAAGEQFVAITDPGTPLERLARERGFRDVFLNPSDIGGRYSALSFFGLVPAALLGLDLAALLERAARMADACAPSVPADENPGLRLGAALGALAEAGRDKVTLVLPPELASFGAWVEQLLAESTGKEGRGLVPVDGEPLGDPAVYGADRVFVALRLAGAVDAADQAHVAALAAAGHPVLHLALTQPLDLGGELFRWEFATAVAGALLGVDPFDEPNVQESKDNTQRVLAAFSAEGRLPEPQPALRADGLAFYGDVDGRSPAAALAAHLRLARPGDYLALQAYLPYDPAIEAALAALRVLLRDRLRLATTVGFGPRFLHSTGQLHKGGPNSGLFIQLTADDDVDVPIPGQLFGFGTLKRAQALGDFAALHARGRRILRVHLGADALVGLRALAAAVREALGP